jgi:hypothetical protein
LFDDEDDKIHHWQEVTGTVGSNKLGWKMQSLLCDYQFLAKHALNLLKLIL